MDKKSEILEKSIILNGPIGSGKSLLSRILAKKLGYPVISADAFRHLPSKKYFQNKAFEDLNEEEKAFYRLRKLLPNVPNYSEMGFNQNIDEIIYKNFGIVAWHFYQKQFETKLLSEIFSQLQTPSIIDLGGGMGISLDRDYEYLKDKAFELSPESFDKYFPMKEYIGFRKIQDLLEKFKNVIYLELPNNYQDYMDKACNILNPIFMSTKQYKMTATQTISVKNLIYQTQPNWNRAEKLADEIILNSGLEPVKQEVEQIKK